MISGAGVEGKAGGHRYQLISQKPMDVILIWIFQKEQLLVS